VQPGKNTDANGILYVSLGFTIDPPPPLRPFYEIDIFQDAARTVLLARGTSSSASGSVMLTGVNNSGLSGTVTINYKADSSQTSIPIVFANPPLVDPDLLIPGDFKHPLASNPAYNLFTARQTTIQGWLNQLTTQCGGTAAGLNTIL